MSMELRREARMRRREQERMEKERKEAIDDLQKVAATPEGARVLRRFLERGEIFSAPLAFGEAAAFASGKRAAAIDLWKTLSRTLPAEDFIRIALLPIREKFAPASPVPDDDPVGMDEDAGFADGGGYGAAGYDAPGYDGAQFN